MPHSIAPRRARTVRFSPIALVVTIVARLLKWDQRYRSRAKLGDLPDYMRRDIGLTDTQINQESQKKFWRP